MSDELKSDFSLIEDKEATTHPAWPAFQKYMEGRSYGYEALNDAWCWFKMGWGPSTPTEAAPGLLEWAASLLEYVVAEYGPVNRGDYAACALDLRILLARAAPVLATSQVDSKPDRAALRALVDALATGGYDRAGYEQAKKDGAADEGSQPWTALRQAWSVLDATSQAGSGTERKHEDLLIALGLAAKQRDAALAALEDALDGADDWTGPARELLAERAQLEAAGATFERPVDVAAVRAAALEEAARTCAALRERLAISSPRYDAFNAAIKAIEALKEDRR